ncbi:MAG: hypothetical protein WC087_01920 [Candidatus Paceibacterota bacterium]
MSDELEIDLELPEVPEDDELAELDDLLGGELDDDILGVAAVDEEEEDDDEDDEDDEEEDEDADLYDDVEPEDGFY